MAQEQEWLQGASELWGEPVYRLGASTLSQPGRTLTVQLRSEHMPQARWASVTTMQTPGLLWQLGGGKPNSVLLWDCCPSCPSLPQAPALWPWQHLQPQDTVSLGHKAAGV